MFDTRVVPEIGSDGEVQSLLSISRDITGQRAAEPKPSVRSSTTSWSSSRTRSRSWWHVWPRIASAPRTGSATASLLNLSERERHILRLLAAGRTNRQIGAEIGLTPGTAKNQVAQILAKLGVGDRTQAAVRAVELGVLESTAGKSGD